MDTKGRIAVPTRIRESLLESCDGNIVVTAHAEERCLLIYPEPEWNEVLLKIQSLPNLNKAAARVQRLVIGYASPMQLDSAGRVLLPTPLREYAGLEKKSMLVGQGKKLELWSEDGWNAWLNSADDGDLTAEMQALSL